MVYCVLRVGKGQRNGMFCGEGLARCSVMVYCVVMVGKVQRNVILCGESWDRAG
jgi:flagellar biosynthesis/type III secretory pathway ATPase